MDTVAIQGISGSFSESAMKLFFMQTPVTVRYDITAEGACAAVAAGFAKYAVVAIDSLVAGSVEETAAALAQYSLAIVDELNLSLSHALLARVPLELSEIIDVHSHEQALKQCREFLQTNCPQAQWVFENDTAFAARRLSEGEWANTSAVIANVDCVDIYGLALLQADIQDSEDNRTRFLLLEKQ